MNVKSISSFCGILGALLFIATSIYGGLQIEGYDFVAQFISESYATGIPNSEYLQYVYVVSGVLLAVFGFLAPAYFPKSTGIKIGFILFAIFYGLGTIATGFFPCDLGCPSDPENSSLSQFIHNTAGFLVYAVVPFCLIGLGVSLIKFQKTKNLSKLSFICGILAMIFVILLFGSPTGPLIGLFQRVIEASILIWVIYCSFYIVRRVKY